MNIWEADITGYGVCISKLDINSVERIEALLDYAPKLKKKIKETFAENGITTPTLDDYDEYDDGDTFSGIAGILQDVILEDVHILFDVYENYNCERYLIFEPRYPWNINKHTPDLYLDLTQENIKDILKKFLSVITDSEIRIGTQVVKTRK